MVATILGFVGIVGFLGLAFWNHTAWLGAIAIYLLMICWSGLQHARALLRFAKLPRRDELYLPGVQRPSADRRLLEVRAVRAGIRHFPDSGRVSPTARPTSV
jgi:hypothetical protein